MVSSEEISEFKVRSEGEWRTDTPMFRQLGAPIEGTDPNTVILIIESCANCYNIPSQLWLLCVG